MSGLADNPGAQVSLVEHSKDIGPCIDALGLHAGHPVLVLVGGADGLDPVVGRCVTTLFEDHLLPLLASLKAVVVDGGTDAGVMACVGQANITGAVDLIGVAAIGTVAVPGLDAAITGETALEPNHSHFLLVPGDRWGDESRWLSLAATTIAGPCPAVTLVVGGGEITRSDVSHSLSVGRTVILLTGTGGVADELVIRTASAQSDDAMSTEVGMGTMADIKMVSLSEADGQLSRCVSKILSYHEGHEETRRKTESLKRVSLILASPVG